MPRPAAAKTGTTDSYRDTWTMGYTPNLTVGVWVGNSDNHPMKEVLSSMSAGKIWRESMDTAIDYLQYPAEEFQRPAGLVDAVTCSGGPELPGPEIYPSRERAERCQDRPDDQRAGADGGHHPGGAASGATAAPPAPRATLQAEEPAEGEAEPTTQPAPSVLFPVAPIVAPGPDSPARRRKPPVPAAPPPPPAVATGTPTNRFQQTPQPLQPSGPAPATKPQQSRPAAKPQQSQGPGRQAAGPHANASPSLARIRLPEPGDMGVWIRLQ